MIRATCLLCLVLPSALVAQASSVPDRVTTNRLATYANKPAKLELQEGIVVSLGPRREIGRFEAVFRGVRSDTVLLESSDGRSSGVVALAEVRSLVVGVQRTHGEGLWHGAAKGATIGASVALSLKLLDNLLATDTRGQRLHGPADGLVLEAFSGAFIFAFPGALLGAMRPGRRWEKLWPR